MDYHISVLTDEVLQNLAVVPGNRYIDATLGGGSHTAAVLGKGGIVLGIDQDQEAIDFVVAKSKPARNASQSDAGGEQRAKGNLILVKGNFRDIDSIAEENGFGQVAGILFDLGVSSYQFDTPERGFSFRASGPLDMRMDKDLSVTAKDLVNGLTKNELADLFYKLGEEHQARRIAQAIVTEREKRPIETTGELEKIVRHAVGGRHMTHGKTTSIHPATKVFQALRIAINDELHSIEDTLPKSVALLSDRGRLVVITFHSLEDRIVKNVFRDFEQQGLGSVLTEKPLVPSAIEVSRNARARSAKLRVFERHI